jgi:hypothetical protein
MSCVALLRGVVVLAAVNGLPLLLATTATAQPGPVVPPTKPEPSPAVSSSLPAGLLSPDALAAYLRQRNYKVDVSRSPQDGRPILLVQIMQDGWKFDLEIEYHPNLGGFFMTCPLGKAGTPMSAAQLTELLKANYRCTPDYFVIRGNDQRLALETNTGAMMTTATFQAILTRFLGNVRSSQAVWDSSQWPATSSMTTPSTAVK